MGEAPNTSRGLGQLALAALVGAGAGLVATWSASWPLSLMAASGGASLTVACAAAVLFLR